MNIDRDSRAGGVSPSQGAHIGQTSAPPPISLSTTPKEIVDTVIASYEQDMDTIHRGPAILVLTAESTPAELHAMLEAIHKEQAKLAQLDENLSELEARGEPSLPVRQLIDSETTRLSTIEKAVNERLEGGTLQGQIVAQTKTGQQEPKVNMFLMPCLSTVVFEVMLEVMKQKIENKDLERIISIDMLATSWKWAQDAAEAAIKQGEAKKAQLIADATASLLTGIVHIGTGAASLYHFKAESARILRGPGSLEEKQRHLFNTLQNDQWAIVTRMLDQSLPQFFQGITASVKTGFVTAEYEAQAQQIIANALKEMSDKTYQVMRDQFQAEGSQLQEAFQDLKQFFAAQTRALKGG